MALYQQPGDVAALAFLNDVESASSIVDTTKADGTTPLLIATLMNKTKAVQLLIEQGADPNKGLVMHLKGEKKESV